MKIKIVQIGKTKAEYIADGINEYLKRLGRNFVIEVVTVKEVGVSKTFPVARCKEEEGVGLLRALRDEDYVVALDEKGKNMGSVMFADLLKKHGDIGRTVVFVIGGAFGLSDAVRERSNLELSLSQMTFTHEMVRLILLEQVYRAGCIIQGKEYHVA